MDDWIQGTVAASWHGGRRSAFALAACLAGLLAGAAPVAGHPPARSLDARPPALPASPAETVWVLQSVEAQIHEAGEADRLEVLALGVRSLAGSGTAAIPSGGNLSASLNVQLNLPRELRAGAAESPGIGADATAGTTGISPTLFPHAEFAVSNGSCPARPLQSERSIGNRSVSFRSPSASCPLDAGRLGGRFTWTMSAGVTVYGPLYPDTDGADGVSITVRATYASTYSLTVDAEPSELPIQVVARAASTVTVTARDPQGAPIAGDPITLSLDPPGLGRLSQASGVTDASGRLQVRYEAPVEAELGGHDQVRILARDGRYGLQAFASLRFGQTAVTLAADPGELPIRSEPAYATVTATVLRGNGQPRPGATLRFRLEPALGELATTVATTDARGQASVRYRAPDARELRAEPRDHVVVHVSDTTDGVEAELLLRFKALKVLGSNPKPEQRDVPPRFLSGEVEIGFVFDQPLDPASLGPSTATVETLRHGRIPATLRVSDSGLFLRLAGSPAEDLGLKVSVHLSAAEGGILSRSGSPLLFPHVLRFQTLPALKPRIIVSQVVDDPRFEGRVTVVGKPFVLRVDAGLAEDSELDEEPASVTLVGPGVSHQANHTFYPGRQGPRVPPQAAALGNTANVLVPAAPPPGSHAYSAVIQPAGDPSQAFTARAELTVNSYPLGAYWTFGRPRIMAYPVVDEGLIPRSTWSPSLLTSTESWAGQALPAAARLLPVKGLDLRVNPPADLSCSPLTCPLRYAPAGWRWIDYLEHWSRRIGRAGWLLPTDIVEVGILPPGALPTIMGQLLLDSERQDFGRYHDAEHWRLWSRAGSPAPLLEPDPPGSLYAPLRILHALGDAEGLSHSFRPIDSFSGYDDDNNYVVTADGVYVHGASRSIMNAHYGDIRRWMTNAQYEAFLLRWSAPPRDVTLGGPDGAGRQQQADEPPALGVSGMIDVAGGRETAYLDPLVHFDGRPTVTPDGAGDYAVELRDAAGTRLGRWAFSPSFSPTEAGRRASFLLAVPRPAGVAAVAIVHAAGELGRRARSAHAPTVAFSRPAAGETIRGEATVAWSGQDADGDPLSYTLLASADAGATWQTVQADTTATTLSLDTRLLPNGPEARLRLHASDGFDTGEALLALRLANPLVVLSTSPGHGEGGVPTRAALEIRPRDPLDPATVNAATFLLRDARGRPVAGDVVYDAPGGVALFLPSGELPALTTFEARLTTGARSPDGRSLAADHAWSFTTRAVTRVSVPLVARGWDRRSAPAPATSAPTPGRVLPFPTETPAGSPSPTASPGASPTWMPPTAATPTPTATGTPPPTPSPTATSALSLDALFTTDGDGAPRMAFVSLEDLGLVLRVRNEGPAPVAAELQVEVRTPDNEVIGLLGGTLGVELPVGISSWPLARQLPTDLPTGQYTVTGTVVAGGRTQARNAVFLLASRLRVADDFGKPGSGWVVDDAVDYATGYLDGEYRILRRAVGWSARSGPGSRMGDVVLEADARLLAEADAAYGLVVGTSDDGNRLTAFLVHPNGSYLLTRNTAGEWQDLTAWTASAALFPGTAANHLMVLRRGSQLRFYANGQPLATVTDAGLPAAGWQGLIGNAWGPPSEARFDNFRAYDP